MEIFTVEGLALLARWLHFFAGITWIGLLYYFNFVQAPFFAEIEADVRTTAVRKLVPRALLWFRWAALVTVVAGIIIILIRLDQSGGGLWSQSYGVAILTGMILGFLMFLNVWGVIWPKQKVVIGSAEQVAGGGQADPRATDAGRRALLASRTNVVLSVPMLFFMATASHLALFTGPAGTGALATYWIIASALILAVEANALVGSTGSTKTPLEKPGSTVVAGVALWVVIYVILQLVF